MEHLILVGKSLIEKHRLQCVFQLGLFTRAYRKGFFLLISLCIYSNLISQPLIEFQKSYGGSQIDVATGITQNSVGGYTISGLSYSMDGQVSGYHSGTCPNGIGCSDYWIVNTDSLGNILWENCFGGTDHDYSTGISHAWNGGSLVCGLAASIDGDVSGLRGHTDAWLVKLDETGNMVWQKSYGGTDDDGAHDVRITSDGGYIFCGYSNSTDYDLGMAFLPHYGSFNLWVLKLDSLGNIQWNRGYGGSNDEWGESIVQTYDGGYAFLGSTRSPDVHYAGSGHHGLIDFVLGRIDSSGNFLWAKCFGGSDDDEGIELKQTPDSGFILVGKTSSIDGQVSSNHDSDFVDIWVVKTDKSGNLEWEKALGGIFWDEAASVLVLEDSSYLVSATVFSQDGDVTNNHGAYDNFLAKLDYSGQLLWSQCYGSYGTDWNAGLIETGQDEWLMYGSSGHNSGDVGGNHGMDDFWLVKLYEPSPIEASINLDSIDQRCTLNDSEQVSIKIINLGELDFYSFQVSYSVNGVNPVTEIITDTLHPDDTLHFTFQTTADFSIPGSYTLNVSVSVAGDAHAFNDSAFAEIFSIQHLSVPVTMGFEDHEIFTGWYSYDLDADGYSGSIVPYSPHSGDKTYVFLPAYTLQPNNQLWTPCIDLNASTDYMMSYWIKVYDSLYPYSLEVYLNTIPDLTGASLISSPQVPTDTSYHGIFAPFTVPQSGTYYVCFRTFATDLTALFAVDDILIDFNTSVAGFDNDNDLLIFPNPAGNFITVHGLKLNAEIKVYDMLGNIVIQKTAINSEENISLNNLVQGMYLVEVDLSNRAKFIKN